MTEEIVSLKIYQISKTENKMKKKKRIDTAKLWDNYERCNIYTMEIPGEDRKEQKKCISENFVKCKTPNQKFRNLREQKAR